MKKLFIPLFFSLAVFTYSNSAGAAFAGRLGLLGIFQRAAQRSRVAAVSGMPFYATKNVTLHELLPVKPSPDYALARQNLKSLFDGWKAHLKAFRGRDFEIEHGLAHAFSFLAEAQRGEQRLRFFVERTPSQPGSPRARISRAA